MYLTGNWGVIEVSDLVERVSNKDMVIKSNTLGKTLYNTRRQFIERPINPVFMSEC